MNKKMKSIKLFTRFFLAFISIILITGMQALNAEDSEKDLFDNARLALFERQWDKALQELDRLTRLYPDTVYYSRALFFKGKCWKEKKNVKKALEYFDTFVKTSENEELKEEALNAIIDLNYQLFKDGNKKAILRIVDLLENSMDTVRYYAAMKLSYVNNKEIADRAVPVLKRIIRKEKDESLVDRAKIALMRINPKYLKKLSEPESLDNAMFVILVYDKVEKKESLNISIPFSLAKLALDAIPNEVKDELKEEGHDVDIDNIIQTITRTRKFVRLEAQDFYLEIGLQ